MTFSFNGFALDAECLSLRREGREIPIRPKSLELLAYLVPRAGQVLSKDELLENVWRGVTVSEDSLTQCISDIRRIIGDSKQEIIRTIPKRGYVFDAEYVKHEPSQKQMPTIAKELQPTIGVLPFAMAGSGDNQQYFADGVTEDIVVELSRFKSLKVIAIGSTFKFRERELDYADVGRKLNASYLVSGSVRMSGPAIRISAHLIHAASRHEEWSDRFDRSSTEIFAVQQEIARIISSTVSGRLEDIEAKRRPISDTVAYDTLLRGIVHIRGFAPDDNRLARECFEHAIRLDPELALAKAYLALSILAENGYAATPKSLKQRATELATRAVELDPNDGRCYVLLGQVYRFSGRLDEALPLMQRGIELNPSDANGLAQMSGLLGLLGSHEESITVLKNAMMLNPLHPTWYWSNLASALYQLGRYSEALDANRKMGPNKRPWQLAREAACLAQLGRLSEAEQVAKAVLDLKPNFSSLEEMPPYKNQSDIDHILTALRNAGLPD